MISVLPTIKEHCSLQYLFISWTILCYVGRKRFLMIKYIMTDFHGGTFLDIYVYHFTKKLSENIISVNDKLNIIPLVELNTNLNLNTDNIDIARK